MIAALRRNPAVAAILDGFAEIALPDCWLVAGVISQTIWNLAHDRPAEADILDIDLIYCDPDDLSAISEAAHEARLRARFPRAKLDVKNQARVHLWYPARFGRAIGQYRSSAEAIASFPTTATAVGIRITADGHEVCAPFGLADLEAGIVRPNKAIVSQAVYEAKAARWKQCWPRLEVVAWREDGLCLPKPLGGSP